MTQLNAFMLDSVPFDVISHKSNVQLSDIRVRTAECANQIETRNCFILLSTEHIIPLKTIFETPNIALITLSTDVMDSMAPAMNTVTARGMIFVSINGEIHIANTWFVNSECSMELRNYLRCILNCIFVGFGLNNY